MNGILFRMLVGVDGALLFRSILNVDGNSSKHSNTKGYGYVAALDAKYTINLDAEESES